MTERRSCCQGYHKQLDEIEARTTRALNNFKASTEYWRSEALRTADMVRETHGESERLRSQLAHAAETINILATEKAALRKAIQDYIDGNWGTRFKYPAKCPHGRFEWEDCGNCVDEYFIEVLKR